MSKLTFSLDIPLLKNTNSLGASFTRVFEHSGDTELQRIGWIGMMPDNFLAAPPISAQHNSNSKNINSR
jgi:hypothetical protein